MQRCYQNPFVGFYLLLLSELWLMFKTWTKSGEGLSISVWFDSLFIQSFSFVDHTFAFAQRSSPVTLMLLYKCKCRIVCRKWKKNFLGKWSWISNTAKYYALDYYDYFDPGSYQLQLQWKFLGAGCQCFPLLMLNELVCKCPIIQCSNYHSAVGNLHWIGSPPPNCIHQAAIHRSIGFPDQPESQGQWEGRNCLNWHTTLRELF